MSHNLETSYDSLHYRQSLVEDDAATVASYEAAVAANPRCAAGDALVLHRTASASSDPAVVAGLAAELYARGHLAHARNHYQRLPKDLQPDDEVLAVLKTVQTQPASAKHPRYHALVYLQDPSTLAHIQPVLPEKIRTTVLTMEPEKNTQPRWRQLAQMAATLTASDYQLLICYADGQAENDAVVLSRLLDVPLLILQLDPVASSEEELRDVPFVPLNTQTPFPPAVWVRYNLGSPAVSAWEINFAYPLHSLSESGLIADAVNRSVWALAGLHLIRCHILLPWDTMGWDATYKISPQFRYQIANTRAFGLTQGVFYAGILELLWLSLPQDHLHYFLQDRTEMNACGLTFEQRCCVFDAAQYAQVHTFTDKVILARLWQNQEFSTMLEYARRCEHELSPICQGWVADAETALRLVELVHAPAATAAEREQPAAEEEKIVCILHTSMPDDHGGYAIRAHGILTHLTAQGVNIVPYTRPGYAAERESAEADGVRYHRLPALAEEEMNRTQFMLQSVRAYKDIFVKEKATKVHVRSTFLIALPAIIAAHQLGLKVLYEVSGLWELTYQGQEHEQSLLRRAPLAEYWETLCARAADEVLTMNESMRKLLISRGADPDHIAIAPNAVDIEKFQPITRAGAGTTRPVRIGYIGSFVFYENLRFIVHALSHLKKRGVAFDAKLIGAGNQHGPVTQDIRKYGLEDLVQAPGRIPHAEVAAEYEQMDIMVYPRRSIPATEIVTPLKPFEALAMGKAIVVSEVAPLREIVGDNERGLAVDVSKAANLADALEQLIQDPALRQRLGQTGRAWVAEHRSWSRVVAAFQNAYRKLD